MPISTGLCGYTHCLASDRVSNNNNNNKAYDSSTRFLVCVTVMIPNPADGSRAERVTTGSARRRRERRLRSMLRHERMSVAMAVAEKLHHSAYRSVPLKEELVEHEKYDALRGQKTASGREATYCTSKTSVARDTAFFSLYDEEDAVWGTRPTGLVELRGPQERIQRHTAEPMIESFVPVPMLDLDAPVPQTVDQLVDVLKLFDNSVPEQVIDVPKISQDAIPQRTVLFELQLAEQLVEVPTAVTFVPGNTLFNDRHGHEWVRVDGPTGVYF